MWAACCNWFCLNGQPEDMPHRPQQGTRTQAYANAGYSSFPSPMASEQGCKACGVQFNSSLLKHICLDCKKSFCPACAHPPAGSSPCLCQLCERFRATAFQWEELIKMKVKDLRDYLELREISTETCREKDELVFLIIGQQPRSPRRDSRTPRGPPLAEEPSAQEEDLVALPQTSVPGPDPDLPMEEQPQANGHVPLNHDEMADIEIAAEALTEEETQSTDSEDNLVPGRRASLSDLTSVQDIDALSVRQLKEILARNFVNYKGCCEKWELMDRVTRLYKEKDLQQLVSDTDDQTAPSGNGPLPGAEENLCKICMDSAINCVLLECGHMVTCTKCGKRMNECPICRQYVIRAVHVFRS
ncbi:E3 ubiquitin-protein ligase rififylin isoform X2 [Hemicordylus capensis]|nr:E3 ubiquitin-protein ligase rififylin isoform X2 [Hemicordylus capensis]XP_053130648.1 E3 ubiquitin-protein ligase rififylin isoform X2 [Hemicordylus capensis]XP_053130649.1 E3 ubiquitin-protein ligase rififylin isoform X2 [Hemicordylus capensis]XP_053130650.1 E3 ubiquitin-protein ligase rififylin isoform X2 [Hemicordylus capensis]XP_053130651.1 E3 ubiquitin-protein ligase rififylin isoform X2 [Hemicordylus capensis]